MFDDNIHVDFELPEYLALLWIWTNHKVINCKMYCQFEAYNLKGKSCSNATQYTLLD